MTTQRSIKFSVSTAYQKAVEGFNKVGDAVGRVNARITQLHSLGRGSTSNTQLQKLTQQATQGSTAFKNINADAEKFNDSLHSMSNLTSINTKEVRQMTNQFDRLMSGVKAFKNFETSLVRGKGAGGQFTGDQWLELRRQGGLNNIPSSPIFTMSGNSVAERQASEDEFKKLTGNMEEFGKSLTQMNEEAADVAKVFGDTTIATSKFTELLDAFAHPDLISIEKMASGPNKGMYGLRGASGELLPGTPGFDTEEEGKRFVNVMGNMREGMQKTIKSQEDINRRQGVSFGNLLGLMIKFGVAMQLIQLPGKIMEGYQQIEENVVTNEYETARTATLLPSIIEHGISEEFTTEVKRLALRIPMEVGGQERIDAIANVIGETASSVETIPNSPGKMVNGKWFPGDVMTAFDLAEVSAKFALAGRETDPASGVGILAKLGTGLQIGPKSQRMTELLSSAVKTVDVGEGLKAGDVSRFTGEVMGDFSSLWGDAPPELQDQYMREIFSMYATSSQTLPPERAATGIRNYLRTILKPTPEVRDKILELKRMTGGDVDLTTVQQVRLGPAGYLKHLQEGLGPEGILVNKFMKTDEGKKALLEEIEYSGKDRAEDILRKSKTREYINEVFKDMRAQRGVQSLLLGKGEMFDQLNTDIQASATEGLLDENVAMLHDTTLAQKGSREITEQIIKEQVFDPEKNKTRTGWTKRAATYALDNMSNWEQLKRLIDPSTKDVFKLVTPSYIPDFDARQISDWLEEGVAPGDIAGKFYDKYESYPPGMRPEEGGFKNWLEIQRNQLNPSNPLEWIMQFGLVGASNPSRRAMDALPPTNELFPEDTSRLTGEEGAENLITALANIGGNKVEGNLNIHITLESGSGDEETVYSVKNAVVDAIGEIFDIGTENTESTMRTLNRNIGVA